MARRSRPEWRLIGGELKRMRRRAALTQTQVAEAMQMVDSHISAWERGTRGMTKDQTEQLDHILSTSGALTRAWVKAHAPDALPSWYEEVPHLEEAATELREYQCQVFPGLTQTPDYAKALIQGSAPWISVAELDRMVKSRMQRQKILAKDHPPLVSLATEASVLTRAIGGRQVLAGQLEQTLRLIDERAIRFQAMPPDLPDHPGASGPFRIYDFADKPAVCSAEHMEGEALMDEMTKVKHCVTMFGILQSEALTPRASVDLIRKVKDEIDGA